MVAILESALDDLREAHALGAASDRAIAALVDPLQVAMANTGGMLGLIYEAYPDLAGEDAPGAIERDASIAAAARGSGSVDRMRALVENAGVLLARAVNLADETSTVKEQFGPRLSESVSALRTIVRALGRSPQSA
jgi:hypothetical protein